MSAYLKLGSRLLILSALMLMVVLSQPRRTHAAAASIDACGQCIADGWQQCGINGGGIDKVTACQDQVQVDCATQGKCQPNIN